MKSLYFILTLMVCSNSLVGMESSAQVAEKIDESLEISVDNANCTRAVIMFVANLGIIVYISILDFVSGYKRKDKLA